MAIARRRDPWWHGDELCAHCFTRYDHVVERRCTSCDLPACPHCAVVVRETREIVCFACERESREGERADEQASDKATES